MNHKNYLDTKFKYYRCPDCLDVYVWEDGKQCCQTCKADVSPEAMHIRATPEGCLYVTDGEKP